MLTQQLIGGRFELGAFIAQGGMGAVYQGRDVHTDQRVAIKRVKPDAVADNPDLIQRFVQEGEALRALNHPNIVKLLAACEQDGQHYLILEYVGGGSLADLLKKQPCLPVDRVVAIALELADALSRAHHLKIIHRDLKPENVLLAEDGTPRLTDFGIARVGNLAITQSGVLLGTYPYLCPEGLNGQTPDHRADLWAFGVLLFEMLAGRRPFTGETFAALMAAILTQPTPDLEALRPDAPAALIDLVYRLLEKNPEQRIPSARLVGAEMEAISRGTPLQPPPRAVSQDLKQNEPTALTERTPLDSPPGLHNLPAQTTPFVGREAELTELASLLGTQDVRLVAILGPGGMGKTRLALEIAADQLPHYPDGVFFVALAPLADPASVVPAIAEAVRFSFQGDTDPQQQLLEFLRNRQLLLILDNFEHLLDAAPLLTTILQAAPCVKVLVTSRSRLNLQEEALFRLEGLDFPDWETPADALEYSAVKLFVQSASRVQPGFALQVHDLTYLARICRQVQGMPLGILLAAAWIDLLSLEEISTEMARSLDFLSTEQRNVPTRQRSIQAVFDYSWTLLSDEERDVFQKLSVFRGGFTREAAQQVADASLRTLGALVNKSMLRRFPDTGRYEIHELLRQYAEKHLAGDRDTVRDCHSRYYADYYARPGSPVLDGVEFNNVLTAWERLVQTRAAEGIDKLHWVIHWFLDHQGRHQEKLNLMKQAETALRSGPPTPPILLTIGGLLLAEGWGYITLGYWEEGKAVVQEGVALYREYGKPGEIAEALQTLAFVCSFRSEFSEALQVTQEALSIGKRLGDERLIRGALYWMSSALIMGGHPADAKPVVEEGIRLARAVGDGQADLFSGLYMPMIHFEAGDLLEAKRRAQEWLENAVHMDYAWGTAIAHRYLGRIAMAEHNHLDAQHHYRESLRIMFRMHQTWEVLEALCNIVELLMAQGDKPAAAELLALIRDHPSRRRPGDPAKPAPRSLSYVAQDEPECLLAQLQAELPPAVFEAAMKRGKAGNLDEVVTALLSEPSIPL